VGFSVWGVGMPSGRDDDESGLADSLLSEEAASPPPSDKEPNGVLAILEKRGVDPKVIREVKKAMEAAGTFVPEPLPPPYINGKPNAEHFRLKLSNLLAENLALQRSGRKGLNNYVAARDGILREAKIIGIDLKALLANRSIDDRTAEAAHRMVEIPPSAFETLDDEIDHLENSFAAGVNGSAKVFGEYEEEARRKAAELRKQGKAWLRRLARIRRLRSAVRNPRPEKQEHLPGGIRWPSLKSDNHHAWAASRVLRVLCYVYRSDRSDVNPVFDIGPHHCRMAVDLYLARNKMAYFVEGSPQECAEHPELFRPPGKAGWRSGVTECNGIVLLVPPRHTKSMVGTAFIVMEFDDNPRLQVKMGHAIEDQCGTNMRFVKSAFSRSEPQGRRNLSIFPAKMTAHDNDQWRMRLVLDEPTRDPQLLARGIKGGVGGTNADIIWLDDPVDPKEVNEQTTRDKTTQLITGQWLRRLQGADSFVIITATPWHPDDGVMTIVRGAMEGELEYSVSAQPVGGPKEDFREIWKGQPSSAIRRAYKEMNDPWAFSCQFELNPTPDSARLIKQISLYVADISQCANPPQEMIARYEAHQRFMKGAECHLSLDPSATSEAKAAELRRAGDRSKRDKSGLVYAAFGHVAETNSLENLLETRQKIRVLMAEKFYASPQESVKKLGEFCGSRRVDMVHIEAVTGFVAIVEGMRNEYGLANNQVFGHKTGNLSKSARLRAVSTMIDDQRAFGLQPPVVEFPGVLNDRGVLVVSPGIADFVTSVLQFGFTKDDHCVDALTQICKFLAPIVGVGAGAVTMMVQAQQHVRMSDDEIRRERLRQAYREADEAALNEGVAGAAYA
jgi:hypothetical protein